MKSMKILKRTLLLAKTPRLQSREIRDLILTMKSLKILKGTPRCVLERKLVSTCHSSAS